jgi:catechol 2,3-dioxygenase-like lactoylglutathione lyase family enzyme
MRPIERIIESALYVDDVERAGRFYRDVLGLDLIASEVPRHVFFRVGESVLLLFDPGVTRTGDHPPPHGATGSGHLAFGVESGELEAWRERLNAHGIAIEYEQSWPRGGRSLYFRDPAGNLLEFVTRGIWGLPSGW